MKLLCVIPARCGSKGIPFKNIINICGKPLIAYTAEIAIKLKKLGYVDTVVVSTDCNEIAQEAIRCGVEVPFLRPKEISGDNSRSIDAVLHALDFYKDKEDIFDAVIFLQPTSPLKTYDDVKDAIDLFKGNECQSLISVYKEETINKLIMYNKKGDQAIPLDSNHNKGVRRQDHGEVFIRNGAIYITSVEYIRAKRELICGVPLMYVMSKNRSINIDTKEDLEFVEYLMCK